MKINTILYPFDLPGNISFKIKKQYLEDSGFIVYPFSYGIRHLRDIQLINFNFFETIHSRNLFICLIKLNIKILIIRYLKLRKIKIVYTIHNKIGHDTKFPWMDKFLMKCLCSDSDRIVILCNETKEYLKNTFGRTYYRSIEGKIERIPLVSYEGAYADNGKDYRTEWGIKRDEMLILFLGGIRRYKNIELILKAAKGLKEEKLKFVIAGGGIKKYTDSLERFIKEQHLENVLFIPRYIEDTEMAAYVRNCDIMIMPFDKKSMLNSGSCMLAFSHHRNVICPLIGTIKDLSDGLCYVYDYSNDAQHLPELCKAIQSASNDFFNNKNEFIKRQEKLYQLSCMEHSVGFIAEKYKELYLELCKGEGK